MASTVYVTKCQQCPCLAHSGHCDHPELPDEYFSSWTVAEGVPHWCPLKTHNLLVVLKKEQSK